jgi:BA14K-like protein
MEPIMFSPKVLSIAAAMTLLLPTLAPTASFAQKPGVARGGGGARVGGGGPRFSGGAPAARFGGNSGGGAPAARFGGGGGYRRGFIPGAGAVVGGAIAAAPYGYYGAPGYYAPGYYAPGYYDDQYYDDGPVVVAPAQGGDDAVAYCMQTYRSYDPRSGTYLGNDGYRHPCP